MESKMKTTTTAMIFYFTLATGGAAVTSLSAEKHEAEIREIAARPDIERAFEVIMELEPRTREDLIMLTEIPAPPFAEEKRAKKYAEMLRQAGSVEVEIDEEGNVVARRRGTSGEKVVALAAHLDTVFPEGTDVTV
jgi:acetylornithine deacetylase/succinyl-diaminopimelate desuccinylase-like protein